MWLLKIVVICYWASMPCHGFDQDAVFVLKDKLSIANWNAAVKQFDDTIVKSRIECSSLCLIGFNSTPMTCNAFVYDETTKNCSLAKITFLEEHQANLSYQVKRPKSLSVSNLNCGTTFFVGFSCHLLRAWKYWNRMFWIRELLSPRQYLPIK